VTMIQSGNVILILDTNVVKKVVVDSDREITETVKSWIISIVERAKRKINGRTITILYSSRILKEYRAGFCKMKKRKLGNALSMFLEKSAWSKIPIACSSGTVYLVPFMINDLNDTAAGKPRMDPYDRKYVSALARCIELRKFSDRYILIASDDRTTCKTFERYVLSIPSPRRDMVRISEWNDIPSNLSDH